MNARAFLELLFLWDENFEDFDDEDFDDFDVDFEDFFFFFESEISCHIFTGEWF